MGLRQLRICRRQALERYRKRKHAPLGGYIDRLRPFPQLARTEIVHLRLHRKLPVLDNVAHDRHAVRDVLVLGVQRFEGVALREKRRLLIEVVVPRMRTELRNRRIVVPEKNAGGMVARHVPRLPKRAVSDRIDGLRLPDIFFE